MEQMCRDPTRLRLCSHFITRSWQGHFCFLREGADFAQGMATGTVCILIEWGKSSTCQTVIGTMSDYYHSVLRWTYCAQKSMSEKWPFIVCWHQMIRQQSSRTCMAPCTHPKIANGKIRRSEDPDPDSGKCSKTNTPSLAPLQCSLNAFIRVEQQ